MRPEARGALSLARKHERAAWYWSCRWHPRNDLVRKHLSKARKLRSRAERLS